MENDPESVKRRIAEILHTCPVCGGRMESAVEHDKHLFASCSDCRLSLAIPASSWDTGRSERKKVH